mgnify:CR=1 FL=1
MSHSDFASSPRGGRRFLHRFHTEMLASISARHLGTWAPGTRAPAEQRPRHTDTRATGRVAAPSAGRPQRRLPPPCARATRLGRRTASSWPSRPPAAPAPAALTEDITRRGPPWPPSLATSPWRPCAIAPTPPSPPSRSWRPRRPAPARRAQLVSRDSLYSGSPAGPPTSWPPAAPSPWRRTTKRRTPRNTRISAAPCCWQLLLAPHAQSSGLSAHTAGGHPCRRLRHVQSPARALVADRRTAGGAVGTFFAFKNICRKVNTKHRTYKVGTSFNIHRYKLLN